MSDKGVPTSPATNPNIWTRKTSIKENVTLISIVFFIFMLLSVLFFIIVKFQFRAEEPDFVEPDDLELSWVCNIPTNATRFLKPEKVTSIIEPSIYCTPEVNDTFIFRSTKRKCVNSLLILIVVSSAAQNFGERMNIRSTWGKTDYFEKDESSRVRLIFSLGMNQNLENKTLKNQIIFESQQYGDILVENFIDNYYNQSLKLLMTFKWIVRHNFPVKFVLKTNDIVHVNTYNLMTFIKKKKFSSLLTGNVKEKCNPTFDYAFDKTYPTCLYNGTVFKYCIDEGGILMSIEVLKKLYLASQKIPLYLIEDVYIGLLANQANLVPQESNKLFNIQKVTPSHICVNAKFIVAYKMVAPFPYILPKDTIAILNTCASQFEPTIDKYVLKTSFRNNTILVKKINN